MKQIDPFPCKDSTILKRTNRLLISSCIYPTRTAHLSGLSPDRNRILHGPVSRQDFALPAAGRHAQDRRRLPLSQRSRYLVMGRPPAGDHRPRLLPPPVT
jgi:hypothetical protein